MMLFGRTRRGHRVLPGGSRPEVAEARRLAEGGQLIDAIEILSEANRAERSVEVERLIRELRNRAGTDLVAAAVPGADYVDPAPVSELPPRGEQSRIPEAPAAEVTAPMLRAAMLETGCLLVRDVLPRDVALGLADAIERAFATRARADAADPDAGYYDEIVPLGAQEIGNRDWIAAGGGILAADSPRILFAMLDALAKAGLRDVIDEYLGERPLLSANKTTLRKAEPDVVGAWHQDGKFMGPVRSVNVWLSLSHCGDSAPGMDIVPKRLDEYVRTGGPGAWIDNQIGAVDAEAAAAGVGVVRPIFEPGDALIFDHLFLHQTGADSSMTEPRYAIESWFFAPSAFPESYVPLVC
jgi:hypothetical protein